MEETHGIALSDAIAQLRTELQVAIEDGKTEKLRFALESVELELHVGVTRSKEAGATARFWVLELGAKAEGATAATQTLKLRLSPRTGDPETLLGR